MLNFTKEQKQFICWLNQDGNYFEVCSDYGKSNGEIIPASELPCRLFQRTINKLYQAGIIYYCSVLLSMANRFDPLSVINFDPPSA